MTPEERRRPEILGGSRKRRVAAGSGTTPAEINQLLNQFRQMQTLMRQLSRGGGMGNMMKALGGLGGLGNLGGMAGMPGLPNGAAAPVATAAAAAHHKDRKKKKKKRR